MSPADAVRTIRAVYQKYSIAIEQASVLGVLLDEAEKFINGAKDLQVPGVASNFDDEAVAVALRLLEVVRLGESLVDHERAGTPKLRQTLETLASFTNATNQHRNQFRESEYELHAASQFIGSGQRVAFVDTSTPSRFNQRVEFMLGYKWPVECKRPQREHTIIPNLKKAVEKLDERETDGVACIALENALPLDGDSAEELSMTDLNNSVRNRVQEWWTKSVDDVDHVLDGSSCRFVVWNYTARAYLHDRESGNLPSLVVAYGRAQEWLIRDVAGECVRVLVEERAQRTGQAVPGT